MRKHRVRGRAAGAVALAAVAALALSACAPAMVRAPVPVVSPPPPLVRLEPRTRQGVRAEIYRWFLKAGYPPYQAAALMDHARIESNYRRCAVGPGGYYYLYQWGGRRLQRLHAFAHSRRCPPLRVQLAFADWELRHERNFACFLWTTSREAARAALRRGFGRGRC